MTTIANYLTIQNVMDVQPDTAQTYPFGFADFGRGGMTYLNTGQPAHFIALVEFDPAKGPRGRHKHLRKQESFYIISGTLKAWYWFTDFQQAIEYSHPTGTMITIQPGLFHMFEAMGETPALALEFSARTL